MGAQLALTFIAGIIATLALGGLVLWGVNERRGKLQAQADLEDAEDELAALKAEIGEAKNRRMSYVDLHKAEDFLATLAAAKTLWEQDGRLFDNLIEQASKMRNSGLKDKE